MNGVIQATIIATDFADSLALKSPTIPVPESKVTVAAPSELNLEAPSFMDKKLGDQPSGGAFAIPAFKLTLDDLPKGPAKK